jgi:hypothetical protein
VLAMQSLGHKLFDLHFAKTVKSLLPEQLEEMQIGRDP